MTDPSTQPDAAQHSPGDPHSSSAPATRHSIVLLGRGPQLPLAVLTAAEVQNLSVRRIDSPADLVGLRQAPAQLVLAEPAQVAACVAALDALAREQSDIANTVVVACDAADANQRITALLQGAVAAHLVSDQAGLAATLLGWCDTAAIRPPRVLLLDDDDDRCARLRTPLQQAGFEVQTVGNNAPPLTAIESAQPDLVLAALQRDAEPDGFALAALLRQQPRLRALPLVLLASEGGEHARLQAIAAGADDLLVEPLRPRLLVAAIRSRLARSRLSSALPEPAAVLRRHGRLRRGEFLAQLREALRDSPGRWLVLLSIRLDQAQALGERLGIGAAFELEQVVAARFAEVFAADDVHTLWLPFGFGVMAQRESREQVVALAECLCRAVADTPFDVGGESLALSASVGIALPPGGSAGGDPDRWFAAAYAAQSIAHRLGGNRYDGVLNHEASAAPAERVLIIREWVKDAAKGNSILVEFQPMLPLHGEQAGAYTVIAKLRDYRAPLEGVTRGEYLQPAREAGAQTMIDRVSLFNAFEAIDAQRQRGQATRVLVPLDLASVDSGQLRWLEAERRRRREIVDGLIIEFDADLLIARPALGAVVQTLHGHGIGLALADNSGSLGRVRQWLDWPVGMLRLPLQAVEGADDASLIDLLQPWHAAGRCVVVDRIDNVDAVSRLWRLGVAFVQGDMLAAAGPRLDFDFQQVGT